jgi:hypothetical protein
MYKYIGKEMDIFFGTIERNKNRRNLVSPQDKTLKQPDLQSSPKAEIVGCPTYHIDLLFNKDGNVLIHFKYPRNYFIQVQSKLIFAT